MEKKIKRWGIKSRFLLVYTVLFLLMAVVIFQYFWDGDRTFVWAQDGLKQHYRALSYYSKWLRELIFRFFGLRGGLPLYSFSLGYPDNITLLCDRRPAQPSLHICAGKIHAVSV